MIHQAGQPLPRPRFSLRISERRLLLMFADGAMLAAALWLALLVPALRMRIGAVYLHWWLVLWGIWYVVAVIAGLYELDLAADPVRSPLTAGGVAGLVALIYLLVPVIAAPLTRSRLGWYTFAGLSMALVAGWRMAYAKLIRQPSFTTRILVAGAGKAGRHLAQALSAREGAFGLDLVGFVDDDPELQDGTDVGFSILGTSSEIPALVQQLHVDQVVLAVTDLGSICPDLRNALIQVWQRGCDVLPMPLFYEHVMEAVPVDHVGQNLFALVGERSTTFLRLWDSLRRLVDLGIGFVGMVITATLFPFIALAIVVDCPGPVFYSQTRVGCGGRIFRIWKYRSMVPDAERGGARWAEANDERITRVGRVLRKTRLDELPQFWNVLNGTMSLIGPRPERPEFVAELEQRLPYYAIRHSVRPGISGWAQVRYHYGNSFEDAKRKLEYDLYYIKHRGPLLDASIALRTIRVVLAMRGT